MVAADEIELYDPTNEASSEYVRRRVWVERIDVDRNNAKSASRFVPAWMYVMIEGCQASDAWLRLVDGDWMKRDRTLTIKKQE